MPCNLLLTSCAQIRRRAFPRNPGGEFFGEGWCGWCCGWCCFFVWVRPWEVKVMLSFFWGVGGWFHATLGVGLLVFIDWHWCCIVFLLGNVLC